jgi:hypothetical protein
LTLSLLFFSGIPRIEKRQDQKHWNKAEYQQYLKQTSPLILMPPPLYARLPMILKRIFFFEWPNYRASSTNNDNDEANDVRVPFNKK